MYRSCRYSYPYLCSETYFIQGNFPPGLKNKEASSKFTYNSPYIEVPDTFVNYCGNSSLVLCLAPNFCISQRRKKIRWDANNPQSSARLPTEKLKCSRLGEWLGVFIWLGVMGLEQEEADRGVEDLHAALPYVLAKLLSRWLCSLRLI